MWPAGLEFEASEYTVIQERQNTRITTTKNPLFQIKIGSEGPASCSAISVGIPAPGPEADPGACLAADTQNNMCWINEYPI